MGWIQCSMESVEMWSVSVCRVPSHRVVYEMKKYIFILFKREHIILLLYVILVYKYILAILYLFQLLPTPPTVISALKLRNNLIVVTDKFRKYKKFDVFAEFGLLDGIREITEWFTSVIRMMNAWTINTLKVVFISYEHLKNSIVCYVISARYVCW